MEETHLTQEHGSLGRTLRKMDSHTKNREYVQGPRETMGSPMESGSNERNRRQTDTPTMGQADTPTVG